MTTNYWRYLTLILCLVAAVTSSTKVDDTNADLYRLPRAVHPEHYKLKVLTHLNETNQGFKFFGKVVIRIVCDEETKNITLHSKNLQINEHSLKVQKYPAAAAAATDASSKVSGLPKSPVSVKDVKYDETYDFMVINLNDRLERGAKYEVYIEFEAELEPGLIGYYRSSYVDKKTQEKRWMTVTQFQATYARRAFPCFDEPALKAVFEVILGHDKKYTALSNMPLKQTREIANKTNWVWDHFDESVPMSTYLLAYSLNDFESRESHTLAADWKFRTWARHDAIDQVDYANYVGPNVIQFYEKYFDIKFPLPKTDMIAIPDFNAGAMENWGLITYRETAVLYSPNISSSSNQHRVASVVAHELAHQWFGNLVTIEWWSDLWLNEGFATYVASLGVDQLHPEWNSYLEESIVNTMKIFKFDALQSSHPIYVPIGDPSEIIQLFDSISYEKGSCILRMMHLYLGPEVFQRGVSNYLKEHKYANARQDDLWMSLTMEAHRKGVLPESMTVKEIMDTWTLQTGYPIVTVTRDYEHGTAEVSQVRYMLADSKRTRSDETACWWVPLSYTTSSELNFNNTMPKDWLSCGGGASSAVVGKQTKTLTGLPSGSDEWVVFNVAMSGLYKVKYDERNWNLLIETLTGPNYGRIGASNRALLVDDALDLAWTGDQDYGIALRLIEYLKQETEYVPWRAALNNLVSVDILLHQTALYGMFREYIQQIIEPIYMRIGGLNLNTVSTEAFDEIKHKILICSWACRFDVGDCQSRAEKYFNTLLRSPNPNADNPVPKDLRSIIYSTAIRNGGQTEWDFLWTMYTRSNVGAEKLVILNALAATKEVWLLQRFLEYTLDEASGVRKQDASLVFSAIASNDLGYYLAKSFLESRIDEIYIYMKPETSRLGRFIAPLASRMSSTYEYNKFEEFLDKNKKVFEKATRAISQTLEKIEINKQWNEKNYKNIGRYLEEYNRKHARRIDVTRNNDEPETVL